MFWNFQKFIFLLLFISWRWRSKNHEDIIKWSNFLLPLPDSKTAKIMVAQKWLYKSFFLSLLIIYEKLFHTWHSNYKKSAYSLTRIIVSYHKSLRENVFKSCTFQAFTVFKQLSVMVCKIQVFSVLVLAFNLFILIMAIPFCPWPSCWAIE